MTWREKLEWFAIGFVLSGIGAFVLAIIALLAIGWRA